MIALLTGTVAEVTEQSLILVAHGVGYRVTVLRAVLHATAVGEELTLRIYHHVTDSSQVLFGFMTKEGLTYFELLLTVPSVGPRTAINILDSAPPKTLAQAMANKDIKVLTKISGVGRKTAERILVELQEKFKDTPITGVVTDVSEQALSVLINMGYTKAQARQVVQELPADLSSVEDAVKYVLQGKKL